MWFEELPEKCPPNDARHQEGKVFYRLVAYNPTRCQDFWSQRKMFPDKVFNAPECIARAVSISAKPDGLKNLQKLSMHKGKYIVRITLQASDGLIKKTGKDQDHYSWWRSLTFNFRQNIEPI